MMFRMSTAKSEHPVARSEASTPRPDRAAARRAEILTAARAVFARDGFHNTKLTSVAKEAGCSVGTLYTYFDDRAALLGAVLDDVEKEMRLAPTGTGSPMSVAEKIAATNRAYLERFRANAKEMALLEQVAQLDETVNAHRISRARRFLERNAAMVASESSVPDPDMVAAALSIMVSRLAYNAWVDGLFPDTDATFERIVAAANEIWLRTLGLDLYPPNNPRQPSDPS